VNAGAPDTEYVRTISRLVLVAAVRRIRTPGAKFDQMLIIEGKQGSAQKSSALATLCPDPKWFTDNFSLSADSKKMMEQTEGHWIVEVGELKGMSKAENSDLKQYLSRQVDSARMSYGRETAHRPRQCVHIGTVNPADGYLNDETGDRRYWPVAVEKFDLDQLRADRDQLWAEAVALDLANLDDGLYTRMDESLWSIAAVEQKARRKMHSYEEVLEKKLGDRVGKIKVSDVKTLVGFNDSDKIPSNPENTQITLSMVALGWERSSGPLSWGPGSKTERGWTKGDTDEIVVVQGGQVRKR
jgi:predicted P-loop ATPase